MKIKGCKAAGPTSQEYNDVTDVQTGFACLSLSCLDSASSFNLRREGQVEENKRRKCEEEEKAKEYQTEDNSLPRDQLKQLIVSASDSSSSCLHFP